MRETPENVCLTHGILPSRNGECPKCSATPETDTVDINAPDTQGLDDWKEAYFRMLNHARSLERRLRGAETACDYHRHRAYTAEHDYWKEKIG